MANWQAGLLHSPAVTLAPPAPLFANAERAYDPSTLRPVLPDWAKLWMQPCRYKSVRGGRGSAKSHTVAQLAVLRMADLLPAYHDGFEPVRIASARAIEESIAESVKQVVEDYIIAYGLDDDFDVRKFEIVHRNGSRMTFPGIEKKLQSFLSKEGIDVLWVEQAEFLTDAHMDYLLPSIRKLTAERWFVWNPADRMGWCWQRFVANPRPADLSLKVNWLNNPWWDLTGLNEERLDDTAYRPHIVPWKWGGEPNDDNVDAVLPYALLDACRKAYVAGLAPDVSGAPAYAGLDLAWGGEDLCALAIRKGPVLDLVEAWPGVSGDLGAAARHAKKLCEPYNLARIYYDSSAPARSDLIRAGFKGIRQVGFGGAIGGPDELYERDLPNRNVFAARNIQMADNLRLRATRTLKLMGGDTSIDPWSCLFIPPRLTRIEQIFAECSQPTRRYNVTRDLWELVKASVSERSPDRFDAVCLAWGRDTDGRGLKAR